MRKILLLGLIISAWALLGLAEKMTVSIDN